MVSQYGIKLAVYLISSFFGELTAKVCECLLRRGTLTLAQIIRFTELSRENVRNCLLVLIHHNCVQAFATQQEGAFGEAPKVITQYMVLFDNIIHHMRFGEFIRVVSEEFNKEKLGNEETGKQCIEIFEGLLQHGRLSLNQIIDRHKQTSNQGVSTAEDVQENFNRLVKARLVERCPAPEPFLAPLMEDEAPAKKRGAKSAKIAEALETVEQRALKAAAPMESIRFLVETEWCNDASDEKPDDLATGPAIGEKRKQHVLESDADLLAAEDTREVLWRVNFEEFIHRLRHKACIANVKARINEGAATVLNAVLDLTRSSETKVKSETSASLSINDIYAEVIKKKDCHGMTLESIRVYLGQLGCEIPLFGIDETYSIDLKSIIELAQNEEVEAIVLKRYGREAYRIFRLLSKAGRLMETDKISDATFVEKKDTVKILYKLWKNDYLHMEKVVAHGAKQSQFLLWKVNKQSLWEHVLDEMYHAALNLRLRLIHEKEREKEVLLIQVPKRLREVGFILESALMNLDEALMLFHDF